MASHTRQREREETRRLSVRTLVIAFIAASTAAVVTSQFWLAGTWVSAGLTPVLVALISELLHRPTAAVSRRITAERTAPLPEAGGPAAPPPAEADPLPQRALSEPGSRRRDVPAPPVQVYGRHRRRRRIALGVVAATAVLAFAAAALAITGADLISGGSIGKGNRKTTLFGGHKGGVQQQPTTTTPTQPQQSPQDTTTSTTPKTTPQKKPPQTTPSKTTPPGSTSTSP